MMKYSINVKGNFVRAQKYEINASYKDLGAVCDAVRYKKVGDALNTIDRIISMEMPVFYRRHNAHMGLRHELGGRKGRYPRRTANVVRLVILNAIANANNKGFDGENMFIVHASANKTHIESRQPSKGGLAWGRGMYGRSSLMHSDIEYAKVEIALANEDNEALTQNMKYFIKKNNRPKKAEKKKDAVVKVKAVQTQKDK